MHRSEVLQERRHVAEFELLADAGLALRERHAGELFAQFGAGHREHTLGQVQARARRGTAGEQRRGGECD
ncbi:MAG: hypothetical protein WAT39_20615, partial [Planctomycetota bacterium]